MATAISDSNTIEFDGARSMAMHARVAHIDKQTQSLKFRLSSILQSSLDLDQVLAVFLEELEPQLEINGLAYVSESFGLNIQLGKRSTHSCGYRLITQKDYLGEISFYRSNRFKENDLVLIEDLLSTLICPLRNALQYREAIIASLTDPLTGAGNRIALENTLKREVDLAKRHHSPLSLIVIDVDDFKKINDNHGHKAGDQVLKQIVATLQEVNRQTDLVYRFGGEEFVVILNETSLHGATVIAERIREAVAEREVCVGDENIQVTVSIGATTLKSSDSRDNLFQRADKALYQAKDQGKNLVIGI